LPSLKVSVDKLKFRLSELKKKKEKKKKKETHAFQTIETA